MEFVGQPGSIDKEFKMNVWKELEHKGRIATVIGLVWALPFNIKTTIDWFSGIFYNHEQLYVVIVVNMLAMFWFILPSMLLIKGPKFEIRVED